MIRAVLDRLRYKPDEEWLALPDEEAIRISPSRDPDWSAILNPDGSFITLALPVSTPVDLQDRDAFRRRMRRCSAWANLD